MSRAKENSDDTGVADLAIDRLLSRLKQLRKERGLSQEAFAESCGISYKYYQALEAGRKQKLRLETVQRLADGLGLDICELLAPVSKVKRNGKAVKGE